MSAFITKEILYFEEEVVVGCDANCGKAWGISDRPRIELDVNEPDDLVFLADAELGDAPSDPGTYEGGHAKPTRPDQRLNKWCVRACERSAMGPRGAPLKLPDWTERSFNMPSRHPVANTVPDPSFRAWLDGLKAPAFLDMDVLLAAGVIDDDEDWLRWRDRGWVDFIIRATDAQQVALFGLVRERLEQQPKLVAADLVGDEERAA